MSLIIEQTFLVGRFHATRWNQNPFEDAHGEWPPSPWRLLRTLLARWYEYHRETGINDQVIRDDLMAKLAQTPPCFFLPPTSTRSQDWPTRGIKQYQPTSLEKSDKAAKEPWVKRAQTTLVVDTFVNTPTNSPVFWIWSEPILDPLSKEIELLDQLLRRITYFGRAESLSRLRRLSSIEPRPIPNTILTPDEYGSSPVLIPNPSQPLNMKSLLASTDDKLMKGRRIPPGTIWWYARRPSKPRQIPKISVKELPPTQIVQFAIGGRVYPKIECWIRITENFRGRAIKALAQVLLGDDKARFAYLSDEQISVYSLFLGKDLAGKPLEGHHHMRILLLPDIATRKLSRLVCFRNIPFDSNEQEALCRASEEPIPWEYGNPDWQLRLVPISSKTTLSCFDSSTTWSTISPYVPPRHLSGRNGKPRPGRSVEAEIQNELRQLALPEANISVDEKHHWVKVHRTLRGGGGPTNDLKRGYTVTLHFNSPIKGPIALGHSSHFGLGLFVPGSEPKPT